MKTFREEFLLKNLTRVGVVKGLQALCGFLTKLKEAECARKAERIVPLVIKFYDTALAANVPCVGLGICPDTGMDTHKYMDSLGNASKSEKSS